MDKIADLKIEVRGRNVSPQATFLYIGDKPEIGDMIQITYDNIKIFDGYIDNIKQYDKIGYGWEIKCIGRNTDLFKVYMYDNETYSNLTINECIVSILQVHLPTWTYNISGGYYTIESITYDKNTLVGEAIELLTDADNLRYYATWDGTLNSGNEQLIVYPVPTGTYNYYYDKTNIVKLMSYEESGDFNNYQIVKGDIGYNNTYYAQSSAIYYITNNIAQSFPVSSNIYIDRVKLYTTNSKNITINVSLVPSLYNMAHSGNVSSSAFVPSSSLVDENISTKASANIASGSTASITITFPTIIPIRQVWWYGYNTNGDSNYEWTIEVRKNNVYTPVAAQLNETIPSGWHTAVFDCEGDAVKFTIKNKSEGQTQYYYINEFCVFTYGYSSNTWWIPDLSFKYPKQLKSYTITNDGGWTDWIIFDNPIDCSAFDYWALIINPNNAKIMYGSSTFDGSLYSNIDSSIENVWKTYQLTFMVGFGEEITATAMDESSIADYGIKAGKVYKNTKIRSYTLASYIASRMLIPEPIINGCIRVPIEPNIKLGDIVKIYLPDYDISGQWEIKGFNHYVGKMSYTDIYFGKEPFDPGVFIERLSKNYDRSRS